MPSPDSRRSLCALYDGIAGIHAETRKHQGDEPVLSATPVQSTLELPVRIISGGEKVNMTHRACLDQRGEKRTRKLQWLKKLDPLSLVSWKESLE